MEIITHPVIASFNCRPNCADFIVSFKSLGGREFSVLLFWFPGGIDLIVHCFSLSDFSDFCWLGISVLLHVSFLLFPSFWYMALKSKCAKILVKHTGRSRNQREVWNGTGQSLFVVGKNLNLLGGFHLDPCAFMFKFMSAYG